MPKKSFLPDRVESEASGHSTSPRRLRALGLFFRLDTLAAASGILGAFAMALMSNPAPAFAMFLASNVGWLGFSAHRRLWPLFAQQSLFLLSSLLGLWNHWLGPLVLG